MDLAAVQGLVAAVDPRYSNWLSWEQRGDIITAKPKFRLPDNAQRLILKVFKRLGGKFVSPGYFELVLRENGSRMTNDTFGSIEDPHSPAPGTVPKQPQEA